MLHKAMIDENEKPKTDVEATTQTAQLAPQTPVAEEASKPALMDEFAKTSTAAKLSGTFHETSGFLKRKIGEFTNDEKLKEAGINQELLGKIHRFVGSVREIRGLVKQKYVDKKLEGQKILTKHGVKLVDVACELADDLKKLIMK